MKQTKHTRPIKIILGICLLLAALYYVLLHEHTEKQLQASAPDVIVQTPQMITMAEYITQTGNTVAYNAVNLVARVEGFLEKIEFTDGTFVKKDSPLFVIQPEPYLEKLKEAKASLAASEANLAYAKAEYARQQQMYKENATSLNSVQKWLAQKDESAAKLDQAKANLVNATINYGYTHIHAPFTGRIGRHLVDTGNLVGRGEATKLATIEQINPIYVYFNMNELDLIKIREAARAQGFNPKDLNQIPVYVGMQNETDFPHEGRLNFVNTGLDASTGTMQFRALLPNKQYALLPGLFVQVRIAITPATPQLTVPDTAVQYDQIGPYVFTVNNNNQVLIKRITLGSLEQGQRAILKGISASDEIIIDGIQNATPGKLVTPKHRTIKTKKTGT